MTEEKKDSEKVGFDKEFTLRALERLVDKREDLQKQYDDLAAAKPTETDRFYGAKLETFEMSRVRQSIESIERKITEAREWYELHELEGLHEESRMLKRLTIALVVLTAILAIFTAFLVFGIRI